jgi:tRNA(Ile)-lysidine synthase
MHNDIITPFNEHINSFRIQEVKTKIAVAISGGPDSLALTLLANQWIKKFKKNKLVALTVNHNLRKESAIESEQVHKLLANHNIEHHILNWDHKEKILSNIQHKARVARRELLTNWCIKHKIKTLLVAHTQNDVVETFFMNIFRGSGIYGLSSIPQETIVNNIQIIRPLLIFTKDELKNYLRKQNIAWIEDPSNKNMKFLRTKVRNLFESKDMKAIFPDKNLFLNRIITNVKNITRARHCIESITKKETAEMVTLSSQQILLARQKFCAAHPEIALNILSSCLITVSKEHEYKPRLNSLKLLYNFICSKAIGTKTLWKCKIKIEKDTVRIQKEML